MKIIRAFLLLPLIFFIGCTSVDFQRGRYLTMGDNTGVKIEAHNGQITHYEVASNVHTPVTRAHYHGVGSIAGQLASFMAGPEVGAGATVLTQALNRPTSRAIITKP